MIQPHADAQPLAVHCAVLTASDSRTVETDRSGQLIQQLLQDHQHVVQDYRLLPDRAVAIAALVQQWCNQPEIDAVILNGGTGIAPRDTTYDAIEQLIQTPIPGFGELFRWLSFQDIGSRAIASRAIAGVRNATLIFSLPGSSNAVRLGMESLILPELMHLTRQMQG
ncbi:MAG: MogA/MoaB family molybdenum cofactor biosynthesis protein [Kaiparowitsia implicata GSE-PSE-MK54-09C]|jgi:molybdenum cofactor biosynthesis protein B|nr:MogA/MoaB family molybdenum cofactor biosynthesis protein [Kaiparowitsia implicata GSE-PSE-MK54-09C]